MSAARSLLPRLVASAGGIGRAPKAPGTFGSLAGLAIGALAMHGPAWLLPALAALATLAGLLAIPPVLPSPEADPGWIVIDEVAGQLVALLGLAAATPLGLLLAFLLFRLFDILKPGPVGWADRLHGATGIMLDDLLAGLVAALLLLAARAAGLL